MNDPERSPEEKDAVEVPAAEPSRPKQKYLGTTWVGGLSEFRDQYTSLALQHKAIEWRTEMAMDYQRQQGEGER